MCPNQPQRVYSNIIRGYSAPRFHQTAKSCYVDFVAVDPASGQMRRKKYIISSRLKKREQRAEGARMVAELAVKLNSGWNPWVDRGNGRNYVTIKEAFDKYLAMIEKQCRKKTLAIYTSRLVIFRNWLNHLPVPPLYAYQIDRPMLVAFLEYTIIDRNTGPRTRNNYLGWLGALCSWMCDHGFIESNPADSIKKLKEMPKKRQPLTDGMLQDLCAYLEKHDRHYLLAVLFEYLTLIRPGELTSLRIKDISLKEQSVLVRAEFSKNKRDGKVTLPERVIRLMLDLDTFRHPGDDYLFSKDFRPGQRKMSADIFNKRWHKVRDALGWPDCFQFYSLKDTGVKDIANTCGIVTARNQARHTDISTTNKYLQGRNAEIPQELKGFTGALEERADE